jgi:hypothetical protein
MRNLLEVKALPDFKLWLRYEDGVEGAVDLSHLVGRGVFAAWNDPQFFLQVKLSDYGAPIWGESVDLCPDSLYLAVTGQQPEDVFPNLRRAASDA